MTVRFRHVQPKINSNPGGTMKALLTRIWETVRVYFGFAADPVCLGDECGTGSLWSPR